MAKKNANGEGSIFKRARNGKTTWYCEIVLGWDENGKKKVLRHSADTRKEVADWRTKRLAERQEGTLVERTKLTVGCFLADWLDSTARHEIKPRTLADYQDLLKRYIVPEVGDTELQKLTPPMIQAMYHRRLEAGLSPSTIRLVHAVLRKGLQQALEWQLINRNPADAVKKPRVERKQVSALTPEQAMKFLRAAREDRLYALYVLAVTTGMRIGELLGLRWSDIDMGARTLTVSQTVGVMDNKLFFGTPKTKASRRTIDVPAVAMAALKKWKADQNQERLKVGDAEAWEYPDLVFTTTIGTPISPNNIRNRSFKPLLAAAGCPRIRLHDLRHTAATLLLSQGVQARVVQDVLGHSDIRMTLGTYAHVLREQQREAAQKMDRLLGEA